MRHTEFWARMEAHFGSAYSHVWADQTVIAALNHLTVNQALDSGLLLRSYGAPCGPLRKCRFPALSPTSVRPGLARGARCTQ